MEDLNWADDAIAAAELHDQVANLSMEWESSELCAEYDRKELVCARIVNDETKLTELNRLVAGLWIMCVDMK